MRAGLIFFRRSPAQRSLARRVQSSSSTVWRAAPALCGLLAAYAGVLAPLLSVLPLWVDEILQLIVSTRAPTLRALLVSAPLNVGAVPLGYLTQRVFTSVLGYSLFSARLPAAVFSVLSVAGAAWLARRLGLKRPVWAMALLAVLPLQLRYATEGRVYSQALCFSILSTLAFLWMRDAPGLRTSICYALSILAGLYTMPFSALVAVGHLIMEPRRVFVPFAAAGVLFLPWFLFARRTWAAASAGNGYAFHADLKMPLLVLREISGGGYIGSILLLALAAYGFLRMERKQAQLLALIVAVPIAGAFALDFAFGYFFAIRQAIFVLPALALLASAGRPVLIVPLLAASLVSDVRMFLRPRDDWALAARTLRATGSCIVTVPPTSLGLYTFFEPLRACSGNEPSAVLAVTPGAASADEQQAAIELDRRGLAPRGSQSAGGTRIATYSLR